MTYDEITQIIADSGNNAWLYNDSLAVFTYKNDLNVTIRYLRDEEDEDIFHEEWAKRPPDKTPKKAPFDLYYGASFVLRRYLVGVDGFRAYLPIPKAGQTIVEKDKYFFARAVDHMGTLEEYMGRCGLTVE